MAARNSGLEANSTPERIMTDDRRPPVALTIAGSDSGGGAGIQADLKTFFAFGVFGTSAITAITAQNTRGVQGVHPVPLEMVRQQIDSVVTDLRPVAVKTGMLATAELVSTVARAIADHELESFVLDPVMVATSGDRLLDEDAAEAVTDELLPLATLVTPNLHEARILTGLPVNSEDEMREAGERLLEMGAGAALVKGGHLKGGQAVDLLVDADGVQTWRRERIPTIHTHGTGCTLSSACAAALARGVSLSDGVAAAIDFVARAIASAPGLGEGNGPVNHFVDPPPMPDPFGP